MASTPLDDGEGIESTPKARGRACTECRSIKVKCENQHSMLDGPCSRCTRLSLQCVYREKKRGRKPRHGNPFSGDGPSEIVLQHTMSPADSSQHSPNTSISQSSFVNHPNHYGDARFEQEYSSSRGQPVSPFTAISSPEVHSSRDSPHHRLQVKSGSHYTPSGLGTHVDSSSGSGSITNASVDPDRSLKLMGSTKEPHPKDAPAGAYSLANILADSRPSSPVHSAPIASMIRNSDPLDNYDTPVTSGILREEDVPELFHLYHEHLNPLIALLDPSLHTPNYVRSRSSILFTAILTVAARFARPHAWERSNALGQTLLGRALADGICSIEYVQALSLLTFWKDSRDSSSWRKVGLAIRMAYELNLHESQKDPLPSSELLARELLNKQRTWLQLVCYDMTTAMQRGKPQMIPDFHISDAYQWLFNHPEYPCNADAMLVISSSFGTVRLLCHSLFSSMTVANKAAFEPLMRHVAQLLDERIKKWVDNEENLQLNLAPISRAIINFQSLNLKLIVAELKLLNLVQPQLSATRIQTLECIKCAMDVLRYVVAELVPNGCIIYCQDALAVMCAYAGVWLFKQLPHVDEELGNEIIDLLRSVSAAGRTLSRQKGDTPSYFVQFFDHLVRNCRNQKVPDTSIHVIPGASAKAATGQQSQLSSSSQMLPPAQGSAHNFPVPELIPPLEGMDYQWTNVVNGLNDWWKNFNYLGADVKGNPNLGNSM